MFTEIKILIIIFSIFEKVHASCHPDMCVKESSCLGGNFILSNCSNTEKGCCITNSHEEQCIPYNYEFLYNCICDRTYRVNHPITCNPLIQCSNRFKLNALENDFCYSLNNESFYWCCLSKNEIAELEKKPSVIIENNLSNGQKIIFAFSVGFIIALAILSIGFLIFYKFYFVKKITNIDHQAVNTHLLNEENDKIEDSKNAENWTRGALVNLLPKIPSSEISMGKYIAKGYFCDIHLAEWENQIVICKMLKDSVKNKMGEMLLNEAAILLKIQLTKSDYFCSFKGIFYTEDGRMGILLEYMNLGNLNEFLVKNKNNGSELNFRELVDLAIQLSKGFHFIQSQYILHGDIAAHNCLLANDQNFPKKMIIKISDFGLSKMFDDKDGILMYNGSEMEMPLPIRWMAPECFFTSEEVKFKFTLNSDKWAFGALLFELFTHGSILYQGKTNQEVMEMLCNPRNNPLTICLKDHPEIIKSLLSTNKLYNAVFKLIILCFKPKPKVRPDGMELEQLFLKLL